MLKTNRMQQVLPNEPTGCAGDEKSSGVPSLVSRIESVRQNLRLADYEDLKPSALDAVVAPWFREAVDAWGLRKNYYERICVSQGHFSEMLSGERPVALRHLIPLHEQPRAVQTLVSPLCHHAGLEPPQPKRTLTRAELAELALEMCSEGPLLKCLERDAKEKCGAAPDEVVRALIGK